MAVLRTTNCRAHGHPEFEIAFDPALVPVENDVHSFLAWLEQSVAEGEHYLPGQTCQVGWAITEVRSAGDDSLSLWEPDMQSMPIVWEQTVSRTLRDLRLQKDVVESVLSPDDLSFPSLLQSGLICTWLGTTTGLIMERVEGSGNDSGWFCGCYDADHDHNDAAELKCVSLYEAAVCYAPQIVPYLALPSGILLSVCDGIPTINLNGEPLEFKPGSLLATRQSGLSE